MQLNPLKWKKEPKKRPLPEPGFDLFRYRDYSHYRGEQIAANRLKLNWVSVSQANVAFLAEYLLKTSREKPTFGLCHGTRRGLEQQWFREVLPGCEVVGTEISDTAEQFPHTIRWDFHDTKPEWISSTDFVYSNSFDHAFDPDKCINAWLSCVKPGGACIIEHGAAHAAGVRAMDPFSARLDVMPYLIARWGRGKFGVAEIIDIPDGKAGEAFLIVRHFR